MSATNIDLSDREGIRTQLPYARELYEAKFAELTELHQEVEHLRAIVAHMAALVGETFETAESKTNTPARSRGIASPAQDAVVAVIERQRRPMKAAEVARELSKEPNAVGAALWAASKSGRLRKVGPGSYAPRDYLPPPEGSLLSSPGGEGGQK